MNEKILLTIITPYYKTLEYTKELSKVLKPQLTDEVEWIIIDDGCNEKELDSLCTRAIHMNQNSGNASLPRNIGLANARGKYIAFIDSDDLVTEDYIEKILDKIKTSPFDYCYISWETQTSKTIIEDEPPEWNVCVWDCIYKRETIGNTRFDLNSNLGEDKKFNQKVRKGKRDNIKEVLYKYNWKRPDSLSTQYREGKIPFER
jgi:glycosyltransferase involved in cell wall biosynthesis